MSEMSFTAAEVEGGPVMNTAGPAIVSSVPTCSAVAGGAAAQQAAEESVAIVDRYLHEQARNERSFDAALAQRIWSPDCLAMYL